MLSHYEEMAAGMLLVVAQKIIEDLGSWTFQEVGSKNFRP